MVLIAEAVEFDDAGGEHRGSMSRTRGVELSQNLAATSPLVWKDRFGGG